MAIMTLVDKMLQRGQIIFGWIHTDWFDEEIKINYVLKPVSFGQALCARTENGARVKHE